MLTIHREEIVARRGTTFSGARHRGQTRHEKKVRNYLRCAVKRSCPYIYLIAAAARNFRSDAQDKVPFVLLSVTCVPTYPQALQGF